MGSVAARSHAARRLRSFRFEVHHRAPTPTATQNALTAPAGARRGNGTQRGRSAAQQAGIAAVDSLIVLGTADGTPGSATPSPSITEAVRETGARPAATIRARSLALSQDSRPPAQPAAGPSRYPARRTVTM